MSVVMESHGRINGVRSLTMMMMMMMNTMQLTSARIAAR